MGVWGILKGMGLVLAGVVDAAVWAAWKQSGAPLGAVLEQFGVKDAAKTPALTPYLTKNYDEVAKLLGKALDVDPAKDETLLGQSSYEIGEFGGKIVGLLTLAGAGGGTAGQTVAGATKALGVAGALKSMEDASASIAKRVRVLNKRKPPPTFTEILLDEAILIEVANILANALGAASGAGDAAPALAKAFARFGWVVDAAQLAPVVAKAWKDYNDPALAKDPEARAAAMRDHLATIVGTIASTAGSKYDDAQAKRAEQAKTEADERFQERYNAREPANAAEPESPAPAMSREEELAKLIAEQEADLAQGDVGLTDVDPGAANVLDLPEYQEGIATASEIFQRLPDIENPKNVAAGVEGEPHLSGWAGEKMEATGRARAEGLEAGYEPEPHFRDPAGSPGQYESSHSERRRAAGTSDQHFGSSKPLCPACQRWFSARAGLEGRPQFVSDPTGVHVFMPDGSHSVPPHPR